MFVTLLTCFVSHAPTFATASSADPVEQKGFFSKNEELALDISVKIWAKGTKKIIDQHWAIGGEMAIGPIIEWQPLHGIGLQTGWFYSYNHFCTATFAVNGDKRLYRGIASFVNCVRDDLNCLYRQYENDVVDFSLDSITFHAFSFPLYFRFYPEQTRQFVLYIGPRFIWMLPGAKKEESFFMHIDANHIKKIVDRALNQGVSSINTDHIVERVCTQDLSSFLRDSIDVNIMRNIVERACSEIFHSIFKPDANRGKNQHLPQCSWDWDFGFEFKGKAGFIVGINGLGLVLGYNMRLAFN